MSIIQDKLFKKPDTKDIEIQFLKSQVESLYEDKTKLEDSTNGLINALAEKVFKGQS